MPVLLNDLLLRLKYLLKEEQEALLRLNRVQDADNADRTWSTPDLERIRQRRLDDLNECRQAQRTVIDNYGLFPSRYLAKWQSLEEFWKMGDFNKSVFIMTKFADGQTEDDEKLNRIITAVDSCIQEQGYIPRIADGRP